MEQKSKLTGWLILFSVLLLLGFLGKGAQEITDVRRAYESQFLQNPSLRIAVLVYQYMIFGAVCAALYTVWLVWKRIPGTLLHLQISYGVAVILRASACWVFAWQLSKSNLQIENSQEMLVATVWVLVFGAIWCVYLFKSRRVRSLYGANSS